MDLDRMLDEAAPARHVHLDGPDSPLRSTSTGGSSHGRPPQPRRAANTASPFPPSPVPPLPECAQSWLWPSSPVPRRVLTPRPPQSSARQRRRLPASRPQRSPARATFSMSRPSRVSGTPVRQADRIPSASASRPSRSGRRRTARAAKWPAHPRAHAATGLSPRRLSRRAEDRPHRLSPRRRPPGQPGRSRAVHRAALQRRPSGRRRGVRVRRHVPGSPAPRRRSEPRSTA